MFVLFLLALFVSELMVIYLLGYETGDAAAKFFVSLISYIFGILTKFFKEVNKTLGFWVFPFLMMAGIVVWSTVRLVKCYKIQCIDETAKHFKILELIQNISPLVGMLGTVVSLYYAMGSMNPKLPQSVLLMTLLSRSSTALITTACGFLLCIAAYVIREIFSDFLIIQKYGAVSEDEDRGCREARQDQKDSMELAGKER